MPRVGNLALVDGDNRAEGGRRSGIFSVSSESLKVVESGLSVRSELLSSTPRKFLILGVIVTIGLVLLGVAGQQFSQARDLERYPPPGDLVSVNGHRLHLDCEGVGRPTVVVEAGLGDYSIGWRAIQESIAPMTRICLYDRAGFGWSEFDPIPPTSEYVARTLHTLLETGGIDGPYILVGHSLGGVYIREFAARFPNEVVGLVFVDSSHENQIGRNSAMQGATRDPLAMRLALCRLLAPLGIIRLSGVMSDYLSPDILGEIRSIRLAAMNRTHFCAATHLARDAMLDVLDKQESPRTLGDLPIIVLTRGLPENPADRSAEAAAWESLWRELQSEIARLSIDSELRVVEHASHFIQNDRSDVVVESIRRLVEQLR